MNDAPQTNASIKWRGDIGPSFFLLLAQTLGAIIAVTMIYSSLSNTVANTKDAADKLATIVARVQDQNNERDNRMTKVETTLSDVKSGVERLSDKIDRLNVVK